MLSFLRRLPLRQLLTLPYVVLVLGVALVIGGLSYVAGQRAVNDLSNQLLRETASRIALATKEHIAGAKGVLEAAFPVGVRPPEHWDEADIAARSACRVQIASCVLLKARPPPMGRDSTEPPAPPATGSTASGTSACPRSSARAALAVSASITPLRDLPSACRASKV